MDRFVSNYANRLDAKGRVSIPAPYRAILAKENPSGLFVQPSLDAASLDAGGESLLQEIDRLLASLGPCSAERDSLSTALLGVSEVLKIDGEGRVVLTEALKAHAGISERVVFVGLGSKFQLWEPERFHAQLSAAQARARELRRLIAERGA